MPDQPSADPVFDTAAAAPLLGFRKGTLGAWRSRGTDPRFVKLGARVVYRLSDLKTNLEGRTCNSTSDLGR